MKACDNCVTGRVEPAAQPQHWLLFALWKICIPLGHSSSFLASCTSPRAISCVFCYTTPHYTSLNRVRVLRLEKHRGQLGDRAVSPIWVRAFFLCASMRSYSFPIVSKSDGGAPHAELALWDVVPNQAYDISLHLVVPANEANIALGNFMAGLTLSSPSNTTIADVRKPVCNPVILRVCQRI